MRPDAPTFTLETGRLNGSFSTLRHHTDAMFGPQRNQRKNFDGMTRNKLELVSLLNHGKQEYGFHHSERCAYANPRSAAKWEIRKPGNLSGANRVLPPALGIESFRVGEEASVALRAPLQNEDIRTRGYPVASQFTIGDRSAAYPPYRRVEA